MYALVEVKKDSIYRLVKMYKNLKTIQYTLEKKNNNKTTNYYGVCIHDNSFVNTFLNNRAYNLVVWEASTIISFAQKNYYTE